MIYINNNHINLLTRNVPCPERLNIELTTGCNLKCVMCRGRNNYVKENKLDKFLKVEDFIRIINGTDLNRLKVINFAGSAEPLLNPYILPILTLCRENGIIVEFITNGMLLTSQISRQILGCASEIHISFGGSTKQTFESIRQGASFELVYENIQTLKELKKSKAIKRIEFAGSLRRKKDLIGDVDILVISDEPKKIMDIFVNLDDVKEVLAKGSTKSSAVLFTRSDKASKTLSVMPFSFFFSFDSKTA